MEYIQNEWKTEFKGASENRGSIKWGLIARKKEEKTSLHSVEFEFICHIHSKYRVKKKLLITWFIFCYRMTFGASGVKGVISCYQSHW